MAHHVEYCRHNTENKKEVAQGEHRNLLDAASIGKRQRINKIEGSNGESLPCVEWIILFDGTIKEIRFQKKMNLTGIHVVENEQRANELDRRWIGSDGKISFQRETVLRLDDRALFLIHLGQW